MTGILNHGIESLIRFGLIEILVFMLVFAIAFGVLQNVKIFGSEREDETKKYNAVIALVLGALSVLPHIIAPGSRYDIVDIVQRALPQTMLVLIALLGMLILLGMFGWNATDMTEGKSWLKPLVGIVLIIIVVWIFIASAPYGWRIPYWLNRDIIAIIVALAVFGIIVGWIMSGGESE